MSTMAAPSKPPKGKTKDAPKAPPKRETKAQGPEDEVDPDELENENAEPDPLEEDDGEFDPDTDLGDPGDDIDDENAPIGTIAEFDLKERQRWGVPRSAACRFVVRTLLGKLMPTQGYFTIEDLAAARGSYLEAVRRVVKNVAGTYVVRVESPQQKRIGTHEEIVEIKAVELPREVQSIQQETQRLKALREMEAAKQDLLEMKSGAPQSALLAKLDELTQRLARIENAPVKSEPPAWLMALIPTLGPVFAGILKRLFEPAASPAAMMKELVPVFSTVASAAAEARVEAEKSDARRSDKLLEHMLTLMRSEAGIESEDSSLTGLAMRALEMFMSRRSPTPAAVPLQTATPAIASAEEAPARPSARAPTTGAPRVQSPFERFVRGALSMFQIEAPPNDAADRLLERWAVVPAEQRALFLSGDLAQMGKVIATLPLKLRVAVEQMTATDPKWNDWIMGLWARYRELAQAKPGVGPAAPQSVPA